MEAEDQASGEGQVMSYEQITKLRAAQHDMAGAFTLLLLSRGGELSDVDKRALAAFRVAQDEASKAFEGGV
jgi:hypothetical protein